MRWKFKNRRCLYTVNDKAKAAVFLAWNATNYARAIDESWHDCRRDTLFRVREREHCNRNRQTLLAQFAIKAHEQIAFAAQSTTGSHDDTVEMIAFERQDSLAHAQMTRCRNSSELLQEAPSTKELRSLQTRRFAKYLVELIARNIK